MPTSEILLTLIDDSNDVVLAETPLDPQTLPESFRAETTLNISDENWWVVEAEPTTREEYVASGRLTLRLRRIEKVAAQDVRFSLPTLCDALPATDGPLIEGTELLLHEDDWRQIEFVAATQKAAVEGHLLTIRAVLEHHRLEGGFGELHPREGLERPMLDAALSLEELRQRFPGARESRVAFDTSSETVGRSFALFVAPGWTLYGLTEASGLIEILALSKASSRDQDPCDIDDSATPAAPEAMQQLVVDANLLWVEWCAARYVSFGDADGANPN